MSALGTHGGVPLPLAGLLEEWFFLLSLAGIGAQVFPLTAILSQVVLLTPIPDLEQ